MIVEPALPQPPDDDSDSDPHVRLSGDLAGQAIHLAALREHSLLSIAELSQNLSGAPDLFDMVDLVLFNQMGQFGTSKSAMWLLSATDGAAVLIRAHGISTRIAQAVGSACASALAQAGPDVPALPVARVGEVYGDAAQWMAERAGLSVLSQVPGRNNALGMIALGPRIGNLGYGSVELTSLRAACSILGVAVQNINLVGRMADRNRELVRMNAELRELDQLKAELLSNVSHELRTPLSIILGYMEFLQSIGLNGPREQEILGTILAEAMKLNGMLGNLLTLSECSRSEITLNLQTGDVGPCVRHFCEERGALANTQLRQLTSSVAENLPRVRFDPERLNQVLEALLDNALKFTLQGTRIQIVARPEPGDGVEGVAVEVIDNGPGISPEVLPIMFEAFRQGDGSMTRRVGGMGIGLAFSRRICEAMGGRLEARSEPGQGSTFSILLFPPTQR